MTETRIAKLFKNGASQAVRLPAEFRFEGTEVYATRDDRTGSVTLSTRPGVASWNDFFALRDTIDAPAEFMVERLMNISPTERNLFGDDD
jgi:antitoxin VapB